MQITPSVVFGHGLLFPQQIRYYLQLLWVRLILVDQIDLAFPFSIMLIPFLVPFIKILNAFVDAKKFGLIQIRPVRFDFQEVCTL